MKNSSIIPIEPPTASVDEAWQECRGALGAHLGVKQTESMGKRTFLLECRRQGVERTYPD